MASPALVPSYTLRASDGEQTESLDHLTCVVPAPVRWLRTGNRVSRFQDAIQVGIADETC